MRVRVHGAARDQARVCGAQLALGGGASIYENAAERRGAGVNAINDCSISLSDSASVRDSDPLRTQIIGLR